MALQAIENGNGEEALKWIAKIDAARKKAADDEAARQVNLIADIQRRMDIIMALQDRVNAKIAGNQAADQAAAIATMASVQTRISTIAEAQAKVDAKIAGNQIADIQARMAAIQEARLESMQKQMERPQTTSQLSWMVRLSKTLSLMQAIAPHNLGLHRGDLIRDLSNYPQGSH